VKIVRERLDQMEAEYIIDSVVQYPVDAQSSGFICAFVSASLAADKVDVNTPVYCGQKRSVCINCGNCGDKPMMARHHSSRYHHYLTVTGIGLLWDDSEISMTGVLDFAMKAAGYNYLILDKANSKTEMFGQIKKSVDNGCPVIMKLGNGTDWHVVTGYDTDNMTLYGIDAHKHWAIKPSVLPDGYMEKA
jgi:ribosomal protein S27AE